MADAAPPDGVQGRDQSPVRPLVRRRPQKSAPQSVGLSEAALKHSFAQLKAAAAVAVEKADADDPWAGLDSGHLVSDAPPEEPAEAAESNSKFLASRPPWAMAQAALREDFSAATCTLRVNLSVKAARLAFVSLVSGLVLEPGDCIKLKTKRFWIRGGWSKPYGNVTTPAGVPQADFHRLQNMSVVEVSTGQLNGFFESYPLVKELGQELLHEAMFPHAVDKFALTKVAVLPQFSNVVHFDFHTDSQANLDKTDLSGVLSIGPGKSNFVVAGATELAAFDRPGQAHLFLSGLFHASGLLFSDSMKLVYFWKAKPTAPVSSSNAANSAVAPAAAVDTIDSSAPEEEVVPKEDVVPSVVADPAPADPGPASDTPKDAAKEEEVEMEQQPENKEANSEEATTFAVIEDPIQQESVSELLGPTQSENVELEGGGQRNQRNLGRRRWRRWRRPLSWTRFRRRCRWPRGRRRRSRVRCRRRMTSRRAFRPGPRLRRPRTTRPRVPATRQYLLGMMSSQRTQMSSQRLTNRPARKLEHPLRNPRSAKVLASSFFNLCLFGPNSEL